MIGPLGVPCVSHTMELRDKSSPLVDAHVAAACDSSQSTCNDLRAIAEASNAEDSAYKVTLLSCTTCSGSLCNKNVWPKSATTPASDDTVSASAYAGIIIGTAIICVAI